MFVWNYSAIPNSSELTWNLESEYTLLLPNKRACPFIRKVRVIKKSHKMNQTSPYRLCSKLIFVVADAIFSQQYN